LKIVKALILGFSDSPSIHHPHTHTHDKLIAVFVLPYYNSKSIERFFIVNKNAFLAFFIFATFFVNKKTLTTVTCQLANYALETLGEG